MFDFIERLRQKPEGTKKKIAFFGAFLFSGIIFLFWIVTVYPDFREQKAVDDKVKKLEDGPISSFGAIFGDNFSKIKEQFSALKELGSSFSTELEYYSASSTISTTTVLKEAQP